MQIREINEHLLDSYSDDIPSFIKKILAARNVSETRLDLTLSKLLHPKFTDLEKANVFLGMKFFVSLYCYLQSFGS